MSTLPSRAGADVGNARRSLDDQALAPQGVPGDDETAADRQRRNLSDLLQELRVAGLGVQVLFGFLLSLPFSFRFGALSGTQRGLYQASLTLAAISIALLVAPVAYHRWVFRLHEKERLLRAANSMALCGLASVALAVSTSVAMVASFVASPAAAVAIVVAVAATLFVLWFAVPLRTRSAAVDGEHLELGQ